MEYTMTDDEYELIREISTPKPVIKIGSYWSGIDGQERANTFWEGLAFKYGFVIDTVKGDGSKDFTAEPKLFEP